MFSLLKNLTGSIFGKNTSPVSGNIFNQVTTALQGVDNVVYKANTAISMLNSELPIPLKGISIATSTVNDLHNDISNSMSGQEPTSVVGKHVNNLISDVHAVNGAISSIVKNPLSAPQAINSAASTIVQNAKNDIQNVVGSIGNHGNLINFGNLGTPVSGDVFQRLPIPLPGIGNIVNNANSIFNELGSQLPIPLTGIGIGTSVIDHLHNDISNIMSGNGINIFGNIVNDVNNHLPIPFNGIGGLNQK